MKTETLYFQDGRSNKVYTATLSDNGIVQFAWGRRGSTMQTKTVGPLKASEAEALYRSKLDEKLAKGYEPGQPATPIETVGFTPAAEPPARPTLVPKPMLLNEITDAELLELAPNPDWYFQEKHDGNRILLVKTGSKFKTFAKLTSYSRSGRETSALPKPIIQAAMDCEEDFILDGEIVGDTLWAFDLLKGIDGDVREREYSWRLFYLGLMFGHLSEGIRVVDTAITPEDKLKLFGNVREKGGEGVVLKQASAPYQAGRPNSGGPALKYKFVATASVIVASHNVQSSFNMKLFDGTDLGRCTIPPNKEAPPVNSVCEVRYLNALRGGSLYQPVYLGVREEIEPSDCTIDQLKFKGEDR